MILAAALGLCLLAWGALALRRRPLALGSVLLAVAGLLVAGEGWTARLLMDPLQRPWLAPPVVAWQPRNTIVMLGAGEVRLLQDTQSSMQPGLFAYPRLAKTMALYHDCARESRQCTVLLSGGDPLRLSASEAATYAHALQAMGLPATDLLLETRSLNTRQNATFTAELLRQHPSGQLLLVTSAYHMRRARACFLAHGLHVVPVASDVLQPGPGGLPSSYNLALSDLALHEWGGWLRDRLLVWLGRPL